jgi:membrane fusion protein, heavy metal efflux system
MTRIPAKTDENRDAKQSGEVDRIVADGSQQTDGKAQQSKETAVHRDSQRQEPTERSWIGLQLVVSLLLAGGVLVWLLSSPFRARPVDDSATDVQPPTEVVKVIDQGAIRITPGTPLAKKLAIVAVRNVEISVPVLSVTGSIVARLRPGSGPPEDRWQFNTSDVLSAYTDWRKSASDIEFNTKELQKVRELDEATVAAQKKVVDRLRKLVAVGTDSEKDLAVEETTLLQDQITGAKSVHEAETALKQAERAHAALARQLQQAGVDPDLLSGSPDGTAVVVADVPEAKVGRVRLDQSCAAHFFGFPDRLFAGKVTNIAPFVAKDSRTLRVMFKIEDPADVLKPGMFAEIGLGTDPRKALMIPADGVLHVGRADYVLVREDSDTWQARETMLGELHGESIEILSGLKEGDRVIGKGAILLKPYLVRALQAQPTTGNPVGSAKER